MTQDLKDMYDHLKRLWLSSADRASRDEAAAEFDSFCNALVTQGADIATKQAEVDKPVEDSVSNSRVLMEIILEVDTTMRMVPSRVKTYRDLLAHEGLDRTSETPGENGMKGLAGINLADQAALEFHRAMLGLAISIAQAEAMERMEKREN